MATQAPSWMTDAEWVCCKTCRIHSTPQGVTFLVSSCGHIFCCSCKERAPNGTCQHCGRNNVEYVELTTDITEHPKIGHYFGMLEDMAEKLIKVLKFQRFHHRKFWSRDEEVPVEDELVRLFGDLAQGSLSDVQSCTAASMASLRQVEEQKAMVDQHIEQLTREWKQLEEELRKMGVNCGPLMGWDSQSGGDWTPSNLPITTPPSSAKSAPFPPTPSLLLPPPLPPPPLPPPLPGSLSPANTLPPSPYAWINHGMPPPRFPPPRINRQNVLASSPAMSSRGVQQLTPQSSQACAPLTPSPMSAQEVCQPTSQLSARLVQMSAARTPRQMVLSTPPEMARNELPHPSKLPRTRTPQGIRSPSPSPRSTPHNYLGTQQLFRGAKVSATVSRKYPNGVRATTPSPVVATARRPTSVHSQLTTPDYAAHKACLTPPSTGLRRLSVRGPPVDGKIGTIPNRTSPSNSMLQLIQESSMKTPTTYRSVTPRKSSGRKSTSYQPMGHRIVHPACYQRPVQTT